MLLPSEYAAALRSTADPSEIARLRNGLARSARDLMVRVMRKVCARHGAQEDAEDRAQELAVPLVDRIVAGQIPPRHGGEDPYLERSARNGARDILRGKGFYKHRRYEAIARGDQPVDEPFATAERQAQHARMRELVRDALPELHEGYREVIEAHRYRGVPLNAIAEQWLAQGKASTLTKARQNVQAAHSRGVRALRELVLRRLAEEGA